MDAYFLHLSNFQTAINNLKNNQIENIIINQNYIKSTINAKEDGTLVFSIPYEDGFTVYLDGKKVETYPVYEMFTALDITSGHHKIEFKYIPVGFYAGLIVSLVSLAGSVAFIVLNKKKLEKPVK